MIENCAKVSAKEIREELKRVEDSIEECRLDVDSDKMVYLSHRRLKLKQALADDLNEARTTFQEVTTNLAKLLVIKEKNYGQSFNRAGDILRIMAPDGIKPDQYDDVLTVVRIIDKLFRVMKGAPDEESPYHDIAGYSILKIVKDHNKSNIKT